MKQQTISLLSLLLCCCLATKTTAQETSSTSGVTPTEHIPSSTPIPPTGIDLKNKKGFKNAFSEAQKKAEKKRKDAALKNKGILPAEQFAKQRFKESYKKINQQYAKVDQHLGSFRSDTKFVKISCKDYQYPDGDRVTIYHNNIPVVYNIVLYESYQSFKINLDVGINTIAFKALNQGTSGPNTAAFKVYDDGGNLISSNEWNLATGAKATIVITKAK